MAVDTLPMIVPPSVEVESLRLRDYQADCIDQLAAGLKAGHRAQILCAPTGAGKTVIAAHLCQRALDQGSKVVFVCDRVVLVHQTSQRFTELGIPHGIIQGNNQRNLWAPIQICSAQTLEKRGFWPRSDLVIVDEAHSLRAGTREFIESESMPVVGLTATPFTRGLGAIYSHVVNATTTDTLISQGWLAPLRVYAATEIDMTGAVKKAGGEWADREVEQRGSKIVGDIVSEWQAKTADEFGGPVKTLAFSATVAHGESICRSFQSAGFDFRQSSYRDSPELTNQMIEDFRAGKYLGLVSVDKFTKGFDVPDVLCLIGARPYRKSFAAHIQQIGRVMRSAPDKPFGLVLDHAGNFEGFYEETMDLFATGCLELDDGKRSEVVRKEGKERAEVKCACGFILEPGLRVCPSCGRERKRRSDVEVAAGRMREIDMGRDRKQPWVDNKEWAWYHICRAALERKHESDLARKFALAQYRSMFSEWPPHEWGFKPVSGRADARVERKITSQIIAWRNSKRSN